MAEGDFLAWEGELREPVELDGPVLVQAREWPCGPGAGLPEAPLARGDRALYVGPIDWLSADGEDRREVPSRVLLLGGYGYVELRLPSGTTWGCDASRVRRVA